MFTTSTIWDRTPNLKAPLRKARKEQREETARELQLMREYETEGAGKALHDSLAEDL